MTKKYPAPLYAAAGAGDYAYRQLLKLRDRLAASDLDVDRLRTGARTTYANLVARGERVVDGDATTAVAVREPADVKPVKRARPAAK